MINAKAVLAIFTLGLGLLHSLANVGRTVFTGFHFVKETTDDLLAAIAGQAVALLASWILSLFGFPFAPLAIVAGLALIASAAT